MTDFGVIQDISYVALMANDPSNTRALLNACSSEGCFYLEIGDLAIGSQSSSILSTAEQVAAVAGGLFELPLEEKLRWEMDKWGSMLNGGTHLGRYKAAGKHTGVIEGGRDGFENFLAPLDAILEHDTNHPNWPPILASNLALFRAFELSCLDISRRLLSVLSNTMPTKMTTPFEDYHRERERSSTSLAMLKYLPSKMLAKDQFGHMAHTDAGSLTMLFTWSPGLQVYHRATNSWISVPPQPGRITINIGDTLSFMSGNTLKSCLHRVVPSLEPSDSHKSKFSIAFFLRPELKATFVDHDGKKWTGEDWHRTKYKVFRAKKEQQEMTSLLTGVTGFLGDLN